MNIQQAKKNWFKTLEASSYMWDRINDNTVWLRFLGYKPAEYFEAQTKIRSLGGFVLNVEFDSLVGQTVITVKEPSFKRKSK